MPIYDLSKPLEMVLYTFFESIGYERPKFRSIDAAASLKEKNLSLLKLGNICQIPQHRCCGLIEGGMRMVPVSARLSKFRSIDAAASLKVYNQRAGYGHWNQKFRSIDAAASLKGMGTIQLPSYTN